MKNKIRRLTPIECERLQGFSDDWTKYGNYDGEVKEVSNTQRYKMCGNAVTVDVVYLVVLQCKEAIMILRDYQQDIVNRGLALLKRI